MAQKVLLTLAGLQNKFGVSKTSAYKLSLDPSFPKPVVSPVHRGRVWRETDVDEWVANLPTKKDGGDRGGEGTV
jgi:predicted DNA-binding transcriptional regulator AlpA